MNAQGVERLTLENGLRHWALCPPISSYELPRTAA
jgi:hypothetical protein